MKKKNDASNAVNAGTGIKRATYSPEQFLEKAAATSSSNIRNDNNNFQYLEIADMEVDAKNLNSSDFHFSKISNVKFTNCDLCYIELDGAELNNVTFEHCKMERAHFNFTQLNGVSFLNCFLDSAEFDFSVGSAVFEACSMEGTEFPMSALNLTIKRCNLERAELNGIHSLKLQAECSSFIRAELNDCTLEGKASRCVFSNAEFFGTNGSSFRFSECKLRGICTEGSVGIEETRFDEPDENIDEELEDVFN